MAQITEEVFMYFGLTAVILVLLGILIVLGKIAHELEEIKNELGGTKK